MKTRLTDQALRNCKPDPSRKPIWDSVVTGLHFRPHTKEKGKGQFYVKYRAGAKQRRQKLGVYPGLKLSEARINAGNVLQAVRRGEDPAAIAAVEAKAAARAERTAPRTDGTFSATVDDFIERYAKRHQRTWRETERVLERLAVPTLGDYALSEVRRRDILDLLHVVADVNGETTANRLHAYLSKLFNWAVIEDRLDHTPMVRGMKPSRDKKRTRTLSDDELRRVRDATEPLGVPYGPFYKFLILTGQRLREVAAMQWSELHGLDGEEPMWIIPAERYKTGEEQRMPLSRAAADLLLTEVRPYIDEEYRHVFVSGKVGDSPINGFGRAKRRIDKLAKVEDWRNHDLRRTMRTFMELDRTIGRAIAERCLGHTIQGIEKHYVAVIPEDHMREAFQAWADHVLSLKDPDDGARKPVERDNVVELPKRVA